MAWEREVWIDDDGSLEVGTEYTADRMNNIEEGIEEKAEKGEKGDKGDPGAEGDTPALQYLFNTNTEVSDPGKTKLKVNNANPKIATVLSISATEVSLTKILAYLQVWDDSTSTGLRGTILVRQKGNPGAVAVFAVTGALTEEAGGEWLKFPITCIKSSGAWANEAPLLVDFSRTGEKGETGGEASVVAEKAEREAAVKAEGEARKSADSARPPALEHDAATLGAAGTGALVIEHTPVTARPRAVIVLVAQNFLTSIADQVINASYGEQLMTRVGTSFVSGRGAVYVYMLTGKIKPGKQSVTVTVSGAASKRAAVITLAGPPGITPKIKLTASQGSGTTPVLEGAGAVWDERVVYSLLSGVQNPAPGAGQTEIGEHEFTSAAFAQWTVNKENTVPGKTPTSTHGTQTTGNYMGVNLSVGFVKDWGEVSELPPSVACAPGDRCSYRAAVGVLWELLYTGEETYPWTKVGGPPLNAVSNESRSLNTTTYSSLVTDPLSLVIPLAGDYDVEVVSSVAALAPGAGQRGGRISYAFGATAAADTWGAAAFTDSASSTRIVMDAQKKTRWTGKAASEKIEEKAKCEGAYEVSFGRRRLWVDPVRVG